MSAAMHRALREQFGDPASQKRRILERRNAELMAEYVTNCGLIAQLRGIELALSPSRADTPAPEAEAPVDLHTIDIGNGKRYVDTSSYAELAKQARIDGPEPRD